jgi:transposase
MKAKQADLREINGLNDKELMSRLYPPKTSGKAPPEPNVNQIFREMQRKNVTLMLLWEEYKRANPDGLMYTQYCERYREFKKQNKLEYHKEHVAGEEVEIDWAGTTVPYVDLLVGEAREACIFIAVLCASKYAFAYACDDMQTPNWIDAHVRALEYFGGVPRVWIPDNTKTAVTTPDKFDPVLNKTYYEMAAHYRATVLPARSYRPTDKNLVENSVGNVSRKILASMRDMQFFSVVEINEVIATKLEELNNKPFQKMEGSRKSLYIEVDQPALMQLPERRYEFADFKVVGVPYNYHVEYEGYFYSVGHEYTGKKCTVRATKDTIEIFVDNERVAAHRRNRDKRKRYTTLPEHMPESHKAVSGWNTERFITWARKSGPNTEEYISWLLTRSEYPIQQYRTCMGIMQYTKTYSSEEMESACSEAIRSNVYSCKYFKLLIEKQTKRPESTEKAPVAHRNIRGRDSFAGGGLNV